MNVSIELIGFGGLLLSLFVSMWRIRTWFNELDKKVTKIDNKIDTHEKICKRRHQHIDEKFDNVDKRFDKMSEHINKLYARTDK